MNWALRTASRLDGPGYPLLARFFDCVGGLLNRVCYWRSHHVWLP